MLSMYVFFFSLLIWLIIVLSSEIGPFKALCTSNYGLDYHSLSHNKCNQVLITCTQETADFQLCGQLSLI